MATMEYRPGERWRGEAAAVHQGQGRAREEAHRSHRRVSDTCCGGGSIRAATSDSQIWALDKQFL